MTTDLDITTPGEIAPFRSDTGTPAEPEGAVLTGGETPTVEGAVITSGVETPEADAGAIFVGEETREPGVSSGIMGDGEPPETLREPRENVCHHEDHTFENNVTIAGTLRTKRWVHPHGCMFQTYAKLVEEYPNPKRGMWAFVGTGFPGKVWVCEKDGKWSEADTNTFGREELETILGTYATQKWVREMLSRHLGEEGASIGHAVEADHALSAYDLDADSPVRDEFLSKKKDDAAKGLIRLLKGAEFGIFSAGLYGGIGGAVDSKGNAEFESALIRTALTVMELVINRQSVQQGDTVFTEGDTIESAEPDCRNEDGTMRWRIRIRPRYEGYVTAIKPGMVIRGVVNNLFDAANPDAHASEYTSWMRVNSLELGTRGNLLSVSLYPDAATPAGRNYPPCPLMTLARWGHETEEALQRLFAISSHEGSLVRYEGVTKPIIDLGNVATYLGRCPKGWFSDIPGVNEGDEILYSKTILGNLIQVSHRGNPVPQIRLTGDYDPARRYRCEAWIQDPETGLQEFITEACTLAGCVWLCRSDLVQGIAPSYGVTQWAFYQGNPAFTIDFEEKTVVYDERQLDLFAATLTLTATLYNQDVLAKIAPTSIEWTRESYDQHGALRAAQDAAWIPNTDRDNKRLLLSKADLGYDGTPISRITFTCRAAIDDIVALARTEIQM